MEFLSEHFGVGFLYLAAGGILIGMLAGLLRHGGLIYRLVSSFLLMICGA